MKATGNSGTNRISTIVAAHPAASHRVMESRPIHLDEDATEYDALVRRHAWLLNRPFVKMIAGLPLETGLVLDVGTGPGWIPIELALRKPGWDIWAVDASEDMLDLARRHAAEAGVDDRVHFIHGDAVDLPFESGRFDLAISHYTLHHIERPAALFDELARVVHGGGRILVKDLLRQSGWRLPLVLAFSRLVLGYSAEQLEMLRESLGSALTAGEVRRELRRSRLKMARVRGRRGLDFVATA